MAVIGLGVIGLELGQALKRMGLEVTGFDMQERIGGIVDDAINAAAIETLGKEIPLVLGQEVKLSEATDGKIQVSTGDTTVVVDKVLASLGRRPNTDSLNLAAAGIQVDARGIPVYDPHTMQIGDSHMFIAGDVTGELAILHEAGVEGRIAGYNAMQDQVRAFKRKTPLSIIFSDPNIVSVGASLAELDPDSIVIGEMPLPPVGRALIMGKNKGLIRVYGEKSTGRILGACMASIKGENLGHLLCWCIEMGLTVDQILRMPFYHPVLEEALQAALYNLRSQLDLPHTDWPMELEPVA